MARPDVAGIGEIGGGPGRGVPAEATSITGARTFSSAFVCAFGGSAGLLVLRVGPGPGGEVVADA